MKKVIVKDKDASKLTLSISTGTHDLTADEPKDLGGEDLGPSPYEYLLTALGSCTAITLKMYAKHKEIPLEGIEVELSHQKISAESDTNKKQDQINLKISLKGNLTSDQKERMLQIADKCPVSRSLQSEIKIVKTIS